jgi:hypothetical protein
MANQPQDRGRVIIAAIAASLLMLALGLTHRVLPARLLTPVSTTPIGPAALERFPLQIGDWLGGDIPLDESILSEIGAEAYVNRRYQRAGGDAFVSLFIAASGVTTGPPVGHAPEVCNVNAGSRLLDQRLAEVPLADGTGLPCQILQFVRGDSLTRERVTVLYYYMADDQYFGNRSLLRLRIRRGPSMVHCVAQVQIVASSPETLPTDSATALVSAFAVASASSMTRLFEDLERNRSSGEFCEPLNGK